MNFRYYKRNERQEIVQLFSSVFTDSEGEEEGILIGQLAEDLFQQTDQRDLFNFVAEDSDQIIASIFFSRVDFTSDVEAFILAPVAVRSDQQGRGIGQALLNYGLSELKDNDVNIVLTYGDPGFYQQVGFRPLSPERVSPPFKLTQPEGWLGQSLAGDAIETMSGIITCVKALSNPLYW